MMLGRYIKDLKNGSLLKKNGLPYTAGSIYKYEVLLIHIGIYEQKYLREIEIIPTQKLNARNLRIQQNYWRKFYAQFSTYLYEDRGCFDNYVGRIWMSFKTFFVYLEQEKNIHTAAYRKYFFSRSEEIQTFVLEPKQLHFLIYNSEFEESLPVHLQKTKDIFVVGCTVALRFSDLINLTPFNLVNKNNAVYLLVNSQKTSTRTEVKLPDYALQISQKHNDKRRKTCFKSISKNQFNTNIKTIGKLAGWDTEVCKIRERNGKPIPVFKDAILKTHFRFYEHLSSHTMRRTAITTMLMLGIPEVMVRGISGHAPNSKEFFKYIRLVQSYLDNETDLFHKRLQEIA